MDAEYALLKAATIEALIPRDGSTPLSELLHSEDAFAESVTGILEIKRRGLLFIDEKVRCLAVLQIPQCEEHVLHTLLAQTDFKVEVWSFDKSHNGDQSTAPIEPVKDLVYSVKVPLSEEPIVLAQRRHEGVAETDILVLVWEVAVTLHRPRIRMLEPSIYVHSVLLVSPSNSEIGTDDSFLEPFQPAEVNALQPMHQLAAFEGRPPYLAASRLERVMPPTPKPSKNRRIENMSPKYKIAPPAIARMRYTRTNLSNAPQETIASLDLEMIPFIEVQGYIEKVEMTIANGQIKNLMRGILPLACRSRDVITFLYRLQPAVGADVPPLPITPSSLPNLDVLTISICIRLKTEDGCESLISMDWTTNVDFFQALNPSFGAPSQPLQRTNRPTSLALGNGVAMQPQTINTSLQRQLPGASRESMTISFTSTPEAVQVGRPFTWQVLVVNSSSRQGRLTIIPLPRVPKAAPLASHFQKRHAPKSSTASFQPAERRHVRDQESDIDFAQATVDENVVYAMQHANIMPPETDLMSLTAEVRIGPLAPGQCHETEIEMVAFKEGVLRVDAIRVIDQTKEVEEGANAPGVITDIRDLPDIVVKACE